MDAKHSKTYSSSSDLHYTKYQKQMVRNETTICATVFAVGAGMRMMVKPRTDSHIVDKIASNPMRL